MCVCVCVCVGVGVGVREMEMCVCVRERVCVCVCVGERGLTLCSICHADWLVRECVFLCETERECVCM